MQFLVGFEKNMKIRPVLRSIVQMAKDLGMGTVTEGVETTEQADYLASIGCDKLQGFLIGKPMRKAEFFAKVNNGELITK
jgi:EAL domain-containing protein (putative c-di-GMP-specific phosphodiesterase class I)